MKKFLIGLMAFIILVLYFPSECKHVLRSLGIEPNVFLNVIEGMKEWAAGFLPS